MIQRGKCPMCGGTMTEDSTHTLLVCDFCGNKEPLNYPVQNQTPNQGQYSLPSTILDTSIAELVFPTTFNTVAGQSIIVAIIVSIGNAATGYPIMLNIIISDIVPPPIGTAVTNNVATNETNNICIAPPNVAIFVPNKQTKNITLNTVALCSRHTRP